MNEDHLKYDLNNLTKWCGFFILLFIFAELCLDVQSVGILVYFNRASVGMLTDLQIDTYGDLIDVSGIFVAAIYLASVLLNVILIGIWIYRASYNAGQLAPDETRISAGWSVGWFFIPFLSMWKPFGAMRETWNGFFNPSSYINAPAPMLIKTWWFAWVVTNILGNISFRVSLSDGPEGYTDPAVVNLIAAPFSILSAFLVWKIIKKINAQQIIVIQNLQSSEV